MPTERLSMRRIRQILLLHFDARQRADKRRDARDRAKHGSGLSRPRRVDRTGVATGAGAVPSNVYCVA